MGKVLRKTESNLRSNPFPGTEGGRPLRAAGLESVIVVSPGGNITALIFDPIPKSEYGEVNALVQAADPRIEQVMFVDLAGTLPRGTMAGGEFCANATRSLGYCLLQGQDGAIRLSVSGSAAPLLVTVAENSAETEIPLLNGPKATEQLPRGISLVRLSGIDHLIVWPDSDCAALLRDARDVDQAKVFARQLMEKSMPTDGAASGVMLLSRQQGRLNLSPFVYVPAVDTFFAETACGSGTAAIAMAIAEERRDSVERLEIVQPSGASLFAKAHMSAASLDKVSVGGQIEILYDGAS